MDDPQQAGAHRATDDAGTARSDALEQLMARVARQDGAAFRALYDATSRCLYAIVLRLLRDPAWTEEVLQEAYVGIWHSAPGYSPAKARPMTWLMSVARNKALDALRSATGERAARVELAGASDDDEHDAPGLPEIADATGGPLERLLDGLQAGALRSCLQGLEAAQRQAIALAFYEGLSHAEVAGHLRQPLGTVKAWVRRGMERLKRCIDSGALAERST